MRSGTADRHREERYAEEQRHGRRDPSSDRHRDMERHYRDRERDRDYRENPDQRNSESDRLRESGRHGEIDRAGDQNEGEEPSNRTRSERHSQRHRDRKSSQESRSRSADRTPSDNIENYADQYVASKPPLSPKQRQRGGAETLPQDNGDNFDPNDIRRQHLDPSSAVTKTTKSRRNKMESMLRNDSLSSDPSDCVRPPPPKPHKHKRGKKQRQRSLSSSDDEIRSTPECTSCDEQEIESESVSEKGRCQFRHSSRRGNLIHTFCWVWMKNKILSY